MVGFAVDRSLLDFKAASAVLSARKAFAEIETVSQFLKNLPTNNGDLLTTPIADGGYGYTADEAYLLRLLFDQFDALNVEAPLELGRKLTGLE